MFAAGASAAESVRIARARLARAIASSDRAAAALREADASRAAIESQRSYTRLAAPIDGVVSLVKAQAGEVVAQRQLAAASPDLPLRGFHSDDDSPGSS